MAWQYERNQSNMPMNWRFMTEGARIKRKRFSVLLTASWSEDQLAPILQHDVPAAGAALRWLVVADSFVSIGLGSDFMPFYDVYTSTSSPGGFTVSLTRCSFNVKSGTVGMEPSCLFFTSRKCCLLFIVVHALYICNGEHIPMIQLCKFDDLKRLCADHALFLQYS